MRLEPYPFGLQRGTHGVERGAEDGTDVEPFHRQHHLAGNDARDVQDVLDQPLLCFAVALDDLHGMCGVFVERTRAQDARPPVDSIEWRAQLV